MKTLTVRLPEPLVAEIEAESRGRKCSKSDVVRERLQRATRGRRRHSSPIEAIAGFLVALLSRRDLHHAWAVIQAPRQAPPWRTCEAVLSEAFDRARTAKGFRLYRFLIGLTSFLAKT